MGPAPEIRGVNEYVGPERRQRTRARVKCPVTVHGKDASGQRINAAAVLENLSASGLCVNSAHLMQPGQRLFAIIHFVPAVVSESAIARVAIRATLVRSEPRPGGRHALGVSINDYRFL